MAIGDVIARLAVNLTMDTAAFESGAKKSGRQTKELEGKFASFSKSTAAIGTTLAAAGGAIAGSAIVSGLASIVEQGFEAAAAIKRHAQLANTSVEEFQKAAFAARTVGIESEKLADIYKDVNDKFGEFLSTGGGELKDFFDTIAPKVGGTAEAFRGLSGKDALQLYVDTLQKAGVNQQEFTFYMEAVADEASALIPLLRDNGREMSNLGQKAQGLGVIMSKEMIDKMGVARTKVSDLSELMKGRLAVTVAENADTIADMADKLARLADLAFRAYRAFQDLANTDLGKLATQLTPIVRGLSSPGLAALQYLGPKLAAAADRAKPQPAPTPRNVPTGSWGGGGFSSSPLLTKPKADPWRTSMVPPLLRKTNLAPMSSIAVGAGIEGAIKAISRKAEAVKVEWADVVKVANDNATGTETANVRIVDSFKDMADETLSSLQNLSNSIRGGGFLDILSNVLGLAMQLGSIGAFGKSFQTRINTVPKHATGTSFASRGLALVGERGPELVNLRGGESIYSNANSRALMGGGRQRVEIIPSPYFNVVVDGRAQGVAAPMAAQAAGAGSTGAQVAIARQRSRALP